MKIYYVEENPYGGTYRPIHSAYLSKTRAQEVSDELRLKTYISDIIDYMWNAEVNREEAVREVDKYFPKWLFQVKELEVEE
jgi:predicted transcriptional regulator